MVTFTFGPKSGGVVVAGAGGAVNKATCSCPASVPVRTPSSAAAVLTASRRAGLWLALPPSCVRCG